MRCNKLFIASVILFSLCQSYFSQNENKKWIWGYKSGLDFSNSPPTAITNAAGYTQEGTASIADANGNLLFYTAGDTIFNQVHQIMANGTGLLGHQSSTQAALIVKKPGSQNLYFVFTTNAFSGGGVYYSIIDMALAAGLGSVTTKNVLVYTPTTEK